MLLLYLLVDRITHTLLDVLSVSAASTHIITFRVTDIGWPKRWWYQRWYRTAIVVIIGDDYC
jgi:hypothetical protein